MSGIELSKLQDHLATLWNTYGPEHVATVINNMDVETIRYLTMANIGARATEV
jgi:hypothetical protein